MKSIKYFFISIFILMIFITYANSATISANVFVKCPFALKLNTYPAYPKLPNQSAPFSIYTTVNCPISNMSGTFFIIANNGSVVYTQSVNNINASQISSLYKLYFNPSNLTTGIYSAKLSFTYFRFTNYSSNKFFLNNLTNIIIENFSTSQKLLRHSNQQFYISLKNTGGFALSNSISIKIKVFGPSNASLSFPSNYSLAPLQYLNITATMTNSTIWPGNYKAILNVTYPTNSTNGIVLMSKYKTINYTVITPPSQQAPPPTYVHVIPQFSLVEFPLSISLNTNQSTLETIGIKNNANVLETVNISVPNNYKNLVGLSATKLAILPNQTININVAFTAQKNYTPGSYIVPININTNVSNSTSSETAYTILSIYNSSNPILPSITLVNNTKYAMGVIKISNPSKENLTNLVLKTILPINITKNISSINLYGLPYSISKTNGTYIINWYINNLPKSTTTFAYFSISNITAQPMLSKISSLLSVQSIPVSSSILKIININIPTFYVNSSNYINVTLLYRGDQTQKISMYLSGPISATIYNSTKYIYATPNEAFARSFLIKPSSSGTMMLNLNIYTENASLNYSIPVLVLPKPPTINVTNVTTKELSESPLSSLIAYISILNSSTSIAIIILIFIVFVLLLYVARKKDKPRYNKERAENLKNMREMIKRGEK
ncbi:MAG: hypothetical protein ACP5RI_00385 [Candidatus Micrarchaeia archaeon]